MTPTAPSAIRLLRMEGITKRFGATVALDGVSFDLEPGEVHALLGENGAGKSTLIKILSGAVKADEGSIRLGGAPFRPSSPLDGRCAGISVVYQELTLAPHLSVEENIMLGGELSRRGLLRRREMLAKVREVLDLISHPEIAPEVPVWKLSIGARQIVEIARALMDRARVLVMDEPTSSLSDEDGLRLFEIIRRLKTQGVGIIYISHFLEEVRMIADRYAVLRDGRNAGAGLMKNATLEDIIRAMVGQDVQEMFPKVDHAPGETALRLDGLKGKAMQERVSFDLRRGEILGVAGLVGSGRTEMLRTIFGLDRREIGAVVVAGAASSEARPWSRIKQGFGLLSEDRQSEGLSMAQSAADNITMSCYSFYRRFGLLSRRRQEKAAARWMEEMKIKAHDVGQPVWSLSGGNQQKLALARLFLQKSDIFLLDEPTRGIDIVSKAQIYKLMGDLAADGKAVIFVSSYFPELLGVCDTIAVFHRGRLVEARPASEWNRHSLMTAATTGWTGGGG